MPIENSSDVQTDNTTFHRQSMIEKRKTVIQLPQNLKAQFKVIQQIRPDSPKTIEACKSLGIPLAIMEFKPLESFAEPDLTEEIQKLRFNHYLQRLNQTAIEIIARRKEIIQRGRQQLRSQQGTTSEPMPVSTDNIPCGLKHKYNSLTSISKVNVANMYNLFSSTQTYFRSSHNNPNTKNLQDIAPRSPNHSDVGSQSQHRDSYEDIEGKLEKEVSRYNRTKNQRLKEALLRLQEDKKRIDLIDRLKKKAEGVVYNVIGLQEQKREKYEEDQKKNQLQEEKIKLQQKEENRKKQEKKAAIEQRLSQEKLRIERENEKRMKIMEEKQQREIIKKQKTERNRLLIRTQQEQDRDNILQTIQEKQIKSFQKYQEGMSMKQLQIRETLEKQLVDHQEKHDQLIEKNLTLKINTTHKKWDYNKKKIEKQLIVEVDKISDRKKVSQQKLERISNNQEKVSEIEIKRMNDMKQSEEEKESNLQDCRKNYEHKQIVSHEMRRLKQQDIQENYERQKRMKQYRIDQIIERELKLKEKKVVNDIEANILQQTAVDKFLQETLEKDRIQLGAEQLSDAMFLHKVWGNILNDQLPWMPEKFSENENLKNGRIAKSLMSQEELNRGFPMFVVPSKKKVNQPIQQKMVAKN